MEMKIWEIDGGTVVEHKGKERFFEGVFNANEELAYNLISRELTTYECYELLQEIGFGYGDAVDKLWDSGKLSRSEFICQCCGNIYGISEESCPYCGMV